MEKSLIQPRLDLALAAAREAGKIILRYYQSTGLTIDRKKDTSPVTIADRTAEEFIRGEIRKSFPADSVLGEEFGETAGTSGFRWILDPLDGTKSFIHGVPLFGTMIGVEYQNQCVVGVVHFPALNETAWGATGLGARWQSPDGATREARVSNVSDISQALFCFTTIQGFGRIGRTDALDALIRSTGLARGWGDCYGHILVATGRAEIMVDPLMNPWDAAALIPIIQEAGGQFMDWNGETTIHSGNGISVNAALRDAVLRVTKR